MQQWKTRTHQLQGLQTHTYSSAVFGGECQNRHSLHAESCKEPCWADQKHSFVCLLCQGSHHEGTDQCGHVRQGFGEATAAWASQARKRAEKPSSCHLKLRLWGCAKKERSSDTKGLCPKVVSIDTLAWVWLIYSDEGLMLCRWRSSSQKWPNSGILLNLGLKISWRWLNTMSLRRYRSSTVI